MSNFKTVYPGQYSPREKKILDETRKKLQEQIGKPTMFPVTPADPTLMRLYANAWDPWNPLFNDDEYAKNTKYGSHHCHSLLEGAGRHVPHAAHGLWRQAPAGQ